MSCKVQVYHSQSPSFEMGSTVSTLESPQSGILWDTVGLISYEALQAFGPAHRMVASKIKEDAAVLQDGDRPFYSYLWNVTWHQYPQISGLFNQIGHLDEVSGQFYVSMKVRALVYLFPLFHGLAGSRIPVVSHIGQNIAPICQVAAVVVNIALLRLGHPVYATTSLSILVFGYLDKNQYLPTRVSVLYWKVSPWMACTATLVTGHWLMKVWAFKDLCCLVCKKGD